MNRLLRVLLSVVIGVAALAGVVYAANQTGVEQAAPHYGPPGVRVVTVNSAVITDDTNFANVNCQGYNYIDLFYRIDQETLPNTISLELEVSPDAVDWYNHNDTPTPLSANIADANGYVDSIANEGYQCRIVANVTNNVSVTPVLKMVLR